MKDQYVAPLYVVEGMKAYAPYGDGRGVLVEVKTAMGDHARVVNERWGVNRLVPISSLRISLDDFGRQKVAQAAARKASE